ncbi:hypothetical protein FC959_17250 [Clostridium botulinum]|uniref:hypothetical protein n=1 Tax=Clostridium botulinum TaxID=1491 RepID=UPI00196709E3|nr:hypothetical protein [Clostridium botulinum]MBN1042360.1 hypothetical protein [Clostridium botulinum]NFI06069.1 hypothetical protein [Clostridium botulinum]
MKTLIIYDNTGFIILQQSGPYRVPEGGVQYLVIEIPENKRLKSIDTSVIPHKPILDNIPKSEIELLKEKIESLEKSNAELTTLVSMQGQNA